MHCIFIAIPKTGTTTVRNQIRPAGRPLIDWSHLSARQIRDTIYTWVVLRNLGTNRQFPTDPDCVQTEAGLRAEARSLFESCFRFAGVRNPWARAVSLYFRTEGLCPDLSDRMSFDDFCEQHLYASDTCGHPILHQAQLDWLVDENDEIIVDYVYRIEEFSTAIAHIRDRTNGRVSLQNEPANVNPASRATTYREMFNGHTRRLIATRFQRDIDHFGYVF